jgi:hypothetical protein
MSRIIIRVELSNDSYPDVSQEFIGYGTTEEEAIRKARRQANLVYPYIDIPMEPGHQIPLANGTYLTMYRLTGYDGLEGL